MDRYSLNPRKPENGHSLADVNPKRAAQWHPTINGVLTLFEVSPGSTIKAWWKRAEGDDHQWDAVIAKFFS